MDPEPHAVLLHCCEAEEQCLGYALRIHRLRDDYLNGLVDEATVRAGAATLTGKAINRWSEVAFYRPRSRTGIVLWRVASVLWRLARAIDSLPPEK